MLQYEEMYAETNTLQKIVTNGGHASNRVQTVVADRREWRFAP
jgi:hypothetical protein